jgi:lysophospholipase L1-like esterase
VRRSPIGEWYADGSGGSCWMNNTAFTADRGQLAYYLLIEYLHTDIAVYASAGNVSGNHSTAYQSGDGTFRDHNDFGSSRYVNVLSGVARYALVRGSSASYTANERTTNTAGAAATGSCTGLALNTWNLGGYGGYSTACCPRAFAVYSGVDHGTADIASLFKYLGTYGRPSTTPVPAALPLVVAFGDSRTWGECAGGSSVATWQTWPGRLAAHLGGKATVLNMGISGNSTANLASTVSDLTPLLTGRSGGTNICVVWAGVNPTSYDYTSLTSVIQSLQSAGWTVVVCVETPSDAVGWGTGSSYTDYRDAIRANSAGADAVADLAANSHLNAVPHDATYTDGLHFTAAGYAEIFGVIKAVVDGLIP